MADETTPVAPEPNKVATIAKLVADNANTVATSAVASAQAEPGKPLLKSKTFWANVVVGGSTYLGYIPAPIAPFVGIGINILMRYLTNQPIKGLFTSN